MDLWFALLHFSIPNSLLWLNDEPFFFYSDVYENKLYISNKLFDLLSLLEKQKDPQCLFNSFLTYFYLCHLGFSPQDAEVFISDTFTDLSYNLLKEFLEIGIELDQSLQLTTIEEQGSCFKMHKNLERAEINFLIFECLQYYRNAPHNSKSIKKELETKLSLLGISMEKLIKNLQNIAESTIRRKIEAKQFSLFASYGQELNAYTSTTLPGVVVKVPKSSTMLNTSKLNNVKKNYHIIKDNLGDLFVIMIVTDIEVELDGVKTFCKYAIIQEKVTILADIIQGLNDKLTATDDTRIKNSCSSQQQDVIDLFIELIQKQWNRGIIDTDLTCWLYNYGITQNGTMVGIDIGGYKYLTDEFFDRYENSLRPILHLAFDNSRLTERTSSDYAEISSLNELRFITQKQIEQLISAYGKENIQEHYNKHASERSRLPDIFETEIQSNQQAFLRMLFGITNNQRPSILENNRPKHVILQTMAQAV